MLLHLYSLHGLIGSLLHFSQFAPPTGGVHGLHLTGVSGSGKSSLMLDILDRAARQRFYNATDLPGEHDTIEGWDFIDKIISIDQSASGRSTRSNAATYTDAFTGIREAFAATAEAKARHLSAKHFSFNVPAGAASAARARAC